MQRTKIFKESVVSTKIVEVLCNMCGEDCKVGNYGNQWSEKTKKWTPGPATENAYEGVIEHEVHGGYFSKLLGDMTSYRYSLCEKCTKKMFSQFKIPVDILDDNTGREYVPESEYEKHAQKTAKAYARYEKDLLKSRELAKKAKK